jgi:3-hydroxyisobutyrate dehydrogenase-like beta-hydroxyacid dehydrogenase
MNSVITKSTQLGFIGIGNMGSRIARRLIDHGYALTVYDRSVDRTSALTMYGAAPANSIADLASKVDVVLSCLTNDESVRSVYLGPDGVLANARLASIVLEMSTVSPDTSREVSRLGLERGLNVLDIAISGSTPAAEQGTLTLLAGGDLEIFNAVEPILQVIARQYFYLGPSGSGTAMKLVVNTLLGVGMQTVAEAVAFGQKAGLDRNVLLDVLAKTAVIPPALVGKLARVSHDNYSPQFPLQLMNKDFRLILQTAAEMKVPMPATAAAFQINSAEFAGEKQADFSIVVELMETLASLRAREQAHTDSNDEDRAREVSPDLLRAKPAA